MKSFLFYDSAIADRFSTSTLHRILNEMRLANRGKSVYLKIDFPKSVNLNEYKNRFWDERTSICEYQMSNKFFNS